MSSLLPSAYCRYTRDPSNSPVLGFHPPEDRHLGDPSAPRCYNKSRPAVSDDKVDDHQFTSYHRGDLSLRYTYEDVDEFNLGGELIVLPIIVHVYRRDFHLHWSELKDYFRDGNIPVLYGPRISDTGTVQEPMNEENFRKLVRRYYMKSFSLAWGPDTLVSERLFERGTGLSVQEFHNAFEDALFKGLVLVDGPAAVCAMSAENIAVKVSKVWNTWHLDAVPRARHALDYLDRQW
ncbi:hypothetical protein B0H13DRAFT_2663615 [Mycena leptocephala]|nr:hypothetical protein B0H13DRAFT_2663615 [Mycena leptocephala]